MTTTATTRYISCQTCHKPVGNEHEAETGECYTCAEDRKERELNRNMAIPAYMKLASVRAYLAKTSDLDAYRVVDDTITELFANTPSDVWPLELFNYVVIDANERYTEISTRGVRIS